MMNNKIKLRLRISRHSAFPLILQDPCSLCPVTDSMYMLAIEDISMKTAH